MRCAAPPLSFLPPHGASLLFPSLPMALPLSFPSSPWCALLLRFPPIADVGSTDGGVKDDEAAAVEGGLCGAGLSGHGWEAVEGQCERATILVAVRQRRVSLSRHSRPWLPLALLAGDAHDETPAFCGGHIHAGLHNHRQRPEEPCRFEP